MTHPDSPQEREREAFENDLDVPEEHKTRYRAVRGAYWWHVQAGSGKGRIGKCFSEKEALRLAAALQTAFYDGHFVAQQQAQAQLSSSQAELAAVREDAERYRFWRRFYKSPFVLCLPAGTLRFDPTLPKVQIAGIDYERKVDAAIDAERARKETE